jgi:hypothetical protein
VSELKLHLSTERIDDLLQGRLSAEQETALAEHLAEDCEQCEAALETLEAAREAELLSLLARIQGATLGPAEREVVIERATQKPWWRRPLIWAPALATAAAGLLLLFFWAPAAQVDGADGGSRIKGAESLLLPVILDVGRVASAGESQGVVERLRNDQRLEAMGGLVFSITTQVWCWPYMVRRSGKEIEVLIPASFEHQTRYRPGRHSPQADGRPLGVAAGALRGEQRFVALCSRARLDRAERVGELADRQIELDPAATSWTRLFFGPAGVILEDTVLRIWQ